MIFSRRGRDIEPIPVWTAARARRWASARHAGVDEVMAVLAVCHGPRCLARYTAEGELIEQPTRHAA